MECKEIDDKQIEYQRYNVRANGILNSSRVEELPPSGSQYFPEYLRAPYVYFESLLEEQLNSEHKVLEIGSGLGQHTGVLVKSGASVIATDISENSLKVLQARIMHQLHSDVLVKVADMEKLPFEDGSIDFVVSAGSLSYGDNNIVRNEIYRVLKQGGNFICVDSLNHNPIYRLNRWVQYLRGKRSKSTIDRMPTISMLKKYESKFGEAQVKFFGSLIWLSPILGLVFGNKNAVFMIDSIDKFIKVYKSAFKFVMIANKKI